MRRVVSNPMAVVFVAFVALRGITACGEMKQADSDVETGVGEDVVLADDAPGDAGSNEAVDSGGGGDSMVEPEQCQEAVVSVGRELAGATFQFASYTRAAVGSRSRVEIGLLGFRGHNINGPGIYEIDSPGLQSCSACVLYLEDTPDGNDTLSFVASEGEIEVDEIDRPTGRLAGRLRSVVLEESTVSGSGTSSFPVNRGQKRCIASMEFEIQLEPVYSDECESARRVGFACAPDPISNAPLIRCVDGEETTIFDVMGEKHLWLVFTTEWCPYCPAEVAELLRTAASEPTLNAAVIMHEDLYGFPPSLETCTDYARRSSSNPEAFYIVSSWRDRYLGIFVPQAGYPLSTLVRAPDRRITYTYGYSPGEFLDALEQLLAEPLE